jgi:hypothetical protein
MAVGSLSLGGKRETERWTERERERERERIKPIIIINSSIFPTSGFLLM